MKKIKNLQQPCLAFGYDIAAPLSGTGADDFMAIQLVAQHLQHPRLPAHVGAEIYCRCSRKIAILVG